MHHVVIFNGKSQLEYLYGVTKIMDDRISLSSKLFQNPYITESLFGILKVIVQEPSTWYPKRGRRQTYEYKIKSRVN